MTAACRACGTTLDAPFLDLGMSPLANRYLRPEQARQMEPFYPLQLFVCRQCALVQLEQFESPEAIFGDYAYFSSYSDSWLRHAKRYAETMTEQLGLTSRSRVRR